MWMNSLCNESYLYVYTLFIEVGILLFNVKIGLYVVKSEPTVLNLD
jgi:hypothetical protein